jgi:hypothetical protein
VRNVEISAAKYNVTKSVRIDSEMAKELRNVALYEKAEPGTLLRMWIEDRLESYRQNPRYKRWRKQLTARTESP